MKKTLLLIALAALLAAGCNKVAQNNQNKGKDQSDQQKQSTSTPEGGQNLPQGNKTGWNSYTSPVKYGFSLQYPKDFGFNTDISKIRPLSYIPACDDTTVACAFVTKDKYQGTNFDSAGVSVNLLTDLNTEAKCYNFNVSTNEAQTAGADTTINGVVFKSATGGGAATGHFDKVEVFRNFHNSTCYEVMARVGSTSIDNYPAGTIKQFNENEIWSSLRQVVSTFKFTASTNQAGLQSYSGQYDSTYEGYITRFSYNFAYPANKFTVSQSNNSVILTETSSHNLLKMTFYSNDAIGAASAKEFWDVIQACPGCKQASGKVEIPNAKETLSFVKGSDEWIIFSPQSGGNYVVLQLQKADTDMRAIANTLSVTTQLIKPGTAQ